MQECRVNVDATMLFKRHVPAGIVTKHYFDVTATSSCNVKYDRQEMMQ